MSAENREPFGQSENPSETLRRKLASGPAREYSFGGHFKDENQRPTTREEWKEAFKNEARHRPTYPPDQRPRAEREIEPKGIIKKTIIRGGHPR